MFLSVGSEITEDFDLVPAVLMSAMTMAKKLDPL
jgi:hypothetical protein